MRIKNKCLLILILTGQFVVISACTSSRFFDSGELILNPTASAEIPFTTAKELIVVKASANGVQGNFIIDNGASVHVLTPRFAEIVNVVSNQSSDVTDANDKTMKVNSAVVNQIILGNAEFKKSRAYIAELDSLFPCDTISGILGASLLNRLVFHYQPGKKVIRLLSNAPEKAETALALRYQRNNSVLTDLTIAGRELETKIDLGSAKPLQISRSAVQIPDEPSREIVGSTTLSVFGLGEIDSLAYYDLNPNIISGFDRFLEEKEMVVKNNLKHPVYLGMGFLKNIEFIYDGPGRKLLLINQDIPFHEEEEYGVGIYRVNGEWQVVSRDLAIPELRSVKIGTRVQSVNGIPMDQFISLCGWEEFLDKQIQIAADLILKLEGFDETFTLSLTQN